MIGNIIITYFSLFSAAFFPLITMPLIAQKLGTAQWGIFSFALLLQMLTLLIDHGLSQAIMREIARFRYKKSQSNEIFSILLKKYKKISIFLSLILISISFLFFKKVDVFFSIIFVGAVVFFQIQTSSCRALMIAFEKHKEIALINILVQAFRYILGYFFVFLISDNVYLFMGWFLFSYAFDFLIKVHIKNKIINDEINISRRSELVADLIFKKAWALSFTVVFGAGLLYLDKLFILISLNNEYLGIYTIASTLAFGVLQVVYPLGQIYTPKLIFYINNKKIINIINNKLFAMVFFIYLIGFLFYYFFGDLIINFWLGKYNHINEIKPLIFLLLIGCFFNSMFNVVYWNFIAKSKIKKIYTIYMISGLCIVSIGFFLVDRYKLLGASLVWSGFHFLCFLSSLYFYKFNKD